MGIGFSAVRALSQPDGDLAPALFTVGEAAISNEHGDFVVVFLVKPGAVCLDVFAWYCGSIAERAFESDDFTGRVLNLLRCATLPALHVPEEPVGGRVIFAAVFPFSRAQT